MLEICLLNLPITGGYTAQKRAQNLASSTSFTASSEKTGTKFIQNLQYLFLMGSETSSRSTSSSPNQKTHNRKICSPRLFPLPRSSTHNCTFLRLLGR